MKQIKVRIYPDGTIESKTEGIKGSSCQDYAKIMQILTAMKPVYIEKTDEYYQHNESAVEVVAQTCTEQIS